MARRRSLESSFWRCGKVTPGLNFRQRLLFLGLISFQDDCGRLHGEPHLVKADVFAFDKVGLKTIEKDLKALERAKLLYLYNVEGRRYIQLHGAHHQKLQHPTPSRIPPLPDRGLLRKLSHNSHEPSVKTSASNGSVGSEVPGREEKRREEKGPEAKRTFERGWKGPESTKPWL